MNAHAASRFTGTIPGLFVLSLALAVPGSAGAGPTEPPSARSPEEPSVAWVPGPAAGQLGSIATLAIPEKFVFAGPEDTRKLMEAMHNPTSGAEMGFVAPVDGDWFVVFEYEETGHIKDDEKAALDADAILRSLREAQEEGNKDRRKRGWETLEITGWMQPPHYDIETHNLEWATRLRTNSGHENVNYNSRLLGRGGVMSATLVGSEQAILDSMEPFKSILRGHSFVPGQRYAEFRAGDKVAKYGLTALITGGAAAVALKTGLFKKFWKLIVLGIAGGIAALRKFFRKAPTTSEDGSTPA
jgi:uncharacterized membrane-anchored protein